MHLGQPLLLSLIFIPADTVPILAEGSYVAAVAGQRWRWWWWWYSVMVWWLLFAARKQPHAHTHMSRLNLVKNINFGLDQKNDFWTYWKTVFWVTEHFCIKWTFWKNAFFCPKNAFFWQTWQFDPLDHPGPRQCQGTFFSGGNFTPIF